MDMLDQKNVVKIINTNELKSIYGGASLSGAVLNYFTKAVNAFLDIGRYLGTAIRRVKNKKMCGF